MSKLSLIRERLSAVQVDALIVESGDAHQSEYVHESDMRRAFISNFTGSAGTALVLSDKALLWTDGRYFLQASQELSDEWTLMRSGDPGVLELRDWILSTLPQGSVVGVDPLLITAANAKSLKNLFASKGIVLKALDFNPVDAIWADRPEPPLGSVRVHDIKYAGLSVSEKISILQAELARQRARAIVITMLDEVMLSFFFFFW